MNRVEILAPAGDYDCFTAAILSGADAVYLGGNFSARAYAKNFTDEEILSAIDYAHFYGRKVYMTLNIVMKQEELDSIGDYLNPFYLEGLDGVIVQDIGLIHYISQRFPDEQRKFSVRCSQFLLFSRSNLCYNSLNLDAYSHFLFSRHPIWKGQQYYGSRIFE